MQKHHRFPISVSIIALLFFLATSQAALSQSTRTWVSVNGNDANDCSRATPCRTFAGALAKSSAGGEIDVLDSGGFGSITIDRSISIVSPPEVLGGIQVSTGNSITISAGPNDNVVLHGLTIEGLRTGLVGIKVLGGLAALHVEKCTINNFRGSNGSGIEVAPTVAGTMQLFVKDTIVRNNGQGIGGGIFVHPGAGVTVKGSLDNVRLEFNTGFGLRAQDSSTLSVHNSQASGNSAAGIVGIAVAGRTVNLMLDHVMVSNNGTDCVAAGANATVGITHVTVYGCATGLNVGAGGAIVSANDNFNQNNTTPGAPTSTPGQQ